MAGTRRLPALAIVALLLVATATADESPPPPEVALSLSLSQSAEGQSPDPAGPAKLEASGESDLSTAAHLGKGVTSLAFPGSPLATEPRDPPPGGESGSESGSVSAGALRGEGHTGPDVPPQSSESEEGGERDPDSEEALAAQGI